jgi:hypothetical protein
MKKYLKSVFAFGSALLFGVTVMAKLPAASEDAKAKAAEAAAKTAWSGKVDGFQLCKAQDRVAAHVKKTKVPEKDVKSAAKSAVVTSTCVDPGPFVYAPAGAAVAPAAAPTSAAVPAKKS